MISKDFKKYVCKTKWRKSHNFTMVAFLEASKMYILLLFYSIFFKLFLIIPWIMSENICVTTRELKSYYQRDEKQQKIYMIVSQQ